jgi:hypothetical protein
MADVITVEERKPVWNTKTEGKRWRGELVPESQLHRCTVEGCAYRSPMAWHVKRHLANVHDIGVTFLFCPEPGCTFKTKDKYRYNQHRKKPHTAPQSVHSKVAVQYNEERRAREAAKREAVKRAKTHSAAAPLVVDEWGFIAATHVKVEPAPPVEVEAAPPEVVCGVCEL